jgi:oxygen-dependent protoporphyrinogen oxidase
MGTGRVVVVGAGVSGLATAFDLARSGADLDVRVLEARSAIGGNIHTLRLDDCIVDAGTDAVRTSRPDGLALCADLGLSDRMVAPVASILVAYGGRLHAVPRRPVDLATTSLLSWRGRARAALGVVPLRRREGESAGDLVERRFGHEVKDRIAEPIVAGICASDIDLMDPEVALSGARTPLFFAPKTGMAEIVDALAAAIGPDRVRTGAAVKAVAKAGSEWRVSVAGAEPIAADHMVIASPPHAASALLGSAFPELADLRTLCVAAVVLTFDSGGDVSRAGDLLLARTERRRTISAAVVSNKWPDRAPAGRVAIRAFVGGDRSPDLPDRDDDAIVSAVLGDLGAYWRLPPLRSSRVVRFGRSAPSPPPGQRKRIDAIRARAAALGGLHLVGGGYSMGLGFSSCVGQARETARAILGLG